MASVNQSLLKFPSGIQLYMKHNEKRLSGITLYHRSNRSYSVSRFDIASETRPRDHMDPKHLYNHFCYYHQKYCPPLLSILFVAQGARMGCSLQQLLDEALTDQEYARIGMINATDGELNKNSTSLNKSEVEVLSEVAPVSVSEPIAAIESRSEKVATTLSASRDLLARLNAKEDALNEELLNLQKIMAKVNDIRELEKKVVEARKILEEAECK